NARNHGRRLGAAYRLRPPPPRAPAKSERLAQTVVDGRIALLRHEQCALSDVDAHRHLGTRQSQPFHAPPTKRRAHPLGLRLCRQASSTELSVARRSLAPRYFNVARHHVTRAWTR